MKTTFLVLVMCLFSFPVLAQENASPEQAFAEYERYFDRIEYSPVPMDNARCGIFGDELKEVENVRPDLINWMPEDFRKMLFDGDLSNGELFNLAASQDNIIRYIIAFDNPVLPNGRQAYVYRREYLMFGYGQIASEQADAVLNTVIWYQQNLK